MVATRLSIYNGALRVLGERRLASLTENREPRRLLDDVWDGGGLGACLEAAQWNWATREVQLAASTSIEPEFGYSYAFEKPTDIVRLLGVSLSPFFDPPLLRYQSAAGLFFCDADQLYLRYVSNDASYGGDYSLWPESYTDFVEAHFASEIAPRLTSSASKVEMAEKKRKDALTEATSVDAMSQPSKSPPPGSWSMARHGDRSRSRLRYGSY